MPCHERDVIQHLLAVDGLGQMFHGQDFVADLPVRAEIDIGVLSAGGLDVVQLNLLQGALSGSGLFGLGGVGGEAGDEFLQLLDLLLFLLVGFLHLLHQQLAGLVPEIVIARVELYLAVIDVRGMGAHLVQEIAVMGDHDDRILKVDQEVLQPCDGVQIQMVGGLVQKQYVRIAEQRLGQQHLHLDVAVQVLHGGIVQVRVDAKAVQDHGGIGLRLPAVHLGEFRFQVADPDAVLVGEVLFGIDGFLFLHDLVQPRVAHDDRVHDRILIVFEMVLLQHGEALAGGDEDLPAGGLQVA